MPLAIAVVPFGLVYGVAVANSTVSPWVGGAASWLVLAGASQLSLLAMIDDGAAWTIAVGTALVINARFALYSVALAPAFREFPWRWRFGLPYVLTDQTAAVALAEFEHEPDPVWRRWFFLGAASIFAFGWWAGTVVGVVAGEALPDWLDIGFAVPAMFIALLVPSITDRPALIAALVAGVVTVLGAGLPNGLNVMVGALSGLVAASTVQAVRR